MNLIEPGGKYLLDGKTEVTVLKASNRAQTVFIVETATRSVLLVERERLQPFAKEA